MAPLETLSQSSSPESANQVEIFSDLKLIRLAVLLALVEGVAFGCSLANLSNIEYIRSEMEQSAPVSANADPKALVRAHLMAEIIRDGAVN